MLVQIFEARARDRAALRERFDRWSADPASRGAGWLGATGGVTADGAFVCSIRYEGAAPREGGAAALVRLAGDAIEGAGAPVATADVTLEMDGSDDAGFVQMMSATVADRARFETLLERMTPAFLALRPDAIGHYTAWFEGGRVHIVDYFTSEAEARAGEKAEMPAELRSAFEEWMSLLAGTRWYDLPDPWFASP